MSRRKPKREWHLYSALAITCALTFIGATYFSGTPQILGAALGPVVGSFLGMSDEWKHQPVEMHKWVVAIPIILLGLTIIIHLFKDLKNNSN